MQVVSNARSRVHCTAPSYLVLGTLHISLSKLDMLFLRSSTARDPRQLEVIHCEQLEILAGKALEVVSPDCTRRVRNAWNIFDFSDMNVLHAWNAIE